MSEPGVYIMFLYNVSPTCCKVNDLFPSSIVNVKHCVETVLLQKISFPNNYAVETLLVLKSAKGSYSVTALI